MSGTTQLKEPIDCTEQELREFARLVRQGFEKAENLDRRIRDAKCLAFYYAADDTLAAVAALKAPHEEHRDHLFKKAESGVSCADYRLDLGWVFVVRAHRGNGIGESLCRKLLARVATSCLFATTRTNNVAMLRLLPTLGFVRVGKPFPRRGEELALFLRPAPALSQGDEG